jgi:hypothetical protein
MRKELKLVKKTVRFLICICVLYIACPVQAASSTIANPQLQMVGARYQSLGGSNPVIAGDINGVFINPAVVGSHEPMLMTMSNQKLMGYFDCQYMACSFPMELIIPMNDRMYFQKVILGFSYGSNTLRDIPLTTYSDDRVRLNGMYSAGFDVFAGTVGVEFYEQMGFDRVSGGASVKMLRQFIEGNTRSSMGLDLGIIGTYRVEKYSIDRFHFGVSILNFIATPLTWNHTGDQAYLPFQLLIGLRADVMEDQLSVFAHNTMDGLAVGAEWYMHESFVLRGSTNLKGFSMGTGLRFANIAGFGNDSYGLRLDYNYTQNIYPFDSDPNNTFSISILGEARPRIPEILVPDEKLLTSNRYIAMSGVGDKDTNIRIYRNGELIRTTRTDKYGRWQYQNFPLREGENELSVKSFSLAKDMSFVSDKKDVFLDTEQPNMMVKLRPQKNKLEIVVQTPTSGISEKLSDVQGLLAKNKIKFRKIDDYKWRAFIDMPAHLVDGSPIPDKMEELMVYAKDKVGNDTGVQRIPFFVSLITPKDKYVHYKDSVRCIGAASLAVSKVEVDGKPVYIDANNKFAALQKLNPGKNLVKLTATTTGQGSITYIARVLSLKTFSDLTKDIKERREIEFLATLGVLDGEVDGNFYPGKDVTRGFIAKMMVQAADVVVEKELVENPFPDVFTDDPYAPYIKASIQEGLMFAYPDGTFKPDKPLTLAESLYLLANAGVIDEEEAPITETKYVKRGELAKYIAYTPRYEIKIERLINWDKGYQ